MCCDNRIQDILKDGWYFLDPIVVLAAGYLWMRQVKSMGVLVRSVCMAGVVLATVYLASVLRHLPMLLTGSFVELRTADGAGYILFFFVPSMVFAAHRLHLKDTWLEGRPLRTSAVLLLTLGALSLSFSRTYWVCFLSAVALIGWRGAGRLFRVAICLGISVVVIYAWNVVRVSPTFAVPEQSETMRYKFADSFQEMAISDHYAMSTINADWRGFEAYRALEMYRKGSIVHQVFGYGLGALVDLGFEMSFGRSQMEFIPILHNGYVYVLIKTGVIGLAIYIAFLGALYKRGRMHTRAGDPVTAFGAVMIEVIAVTFLLTALVITGIYNKTVLTPLVFLLGSFLFITSRYSRQCRDEHARAFTPVRSVRSAL